jgi:hypothetical protein
MVGDIWGMDDSNLLVVRITKAVSIGTSTIHNSARGGTGDSDRHREAQRHNRQTHSYRR